MGPQYTQVKHPPHQHATLSDSTNHKSKILEEESRSYQIANMEHILTKH